MTAPLPKEALDYFDAKKIKPAFSYLDVWSEEHATNFTVAKAVTFDIAEDIKAEMRKALSEGKTFREIAKDLTPILQKKGWWGKRDMIDPETGEILEVQLGSIRRLRTIYDSNIRTARAAGQWERIQRVKETLPYLVYELGPSVEHRAEHVKWAGLILPVDHPFWITHFAPNGWGCKCRIRQISQRQYDRLVKTGKYTTKTVPPIDVKYKTKAPEIVTRPFTNKRTGLVEAVPVGIDPGWNTNAGYLRQINVDRQYAAKALKLDGYSHAQAAALFVSSVRMSELAEWMDRMSQTDRPGGELKTVAMIGKLEIDHLASKGISLAETLTLLEGRLLAKAGGYKPNKNKRHTKKDGFTLEQWQALPEYLASPTRIVRQKNDIIYLIKEKDQWLKIVVTINFKSKRAKRIGLAEKINMVRTGFVIPAEAVTSILKDPMSEIIK